MAINITGEEGKYRANLTHGTTTVSCPNAGAAVTDTATNMLRLVVDAIDRGWFRADATQIGVIGKAHSTTLDASRQPVPDAKHITVTVLVKPGGKAKHLYLLPDDGTDDVLETTTLDDEKVPANP
ncbi:hypothetical protein BKA70DRAFT_1433849 [Coprinopsis sp. MPI-PUGE-AT-0042]|nr:hypothetical protein BKA70DRAFT_1433849 [Coprinopsis sp. MPI-PUGE-AT-0042]